MAILEHEEHYDGRSAKLKEDGSLAFTREWWVKIDKPSTSGPDEIRLDPRTPRIGQAYTSGTDSVDFVFCRDISIRVTPDGGDGTHYRIKATYERPKVEPGHETEDPRLDPPVFWSDVITYQVVAERGRLKVGVNNYQAAWEPITNSANDRFDPPHMKDFSRVTLVVQRNEPNFDLSVSEGWTDTVNSNRFSIGPKTVIPGECKIAKITQTVEYKTLSTGNTIIYYPTTYEFHFHERDHVKLTSDGALVATQGWDLVAPDLGFYELRDDPDDLTQQIKVEISADVAMHRNVIQPVRLNGSGVALRPDRPLGDTAYRVYRIYPTNDFAQLGIF